MRPAYNEFGNNDHLAIKQADFFAWKLVTAMLKKSSVITSTHFFASSIFCIFYSL